MRKFLHLNTILFALVLCLGTLSSCKSHNDELSRDEKLMVLDAQIKKSPKDADLYYQRGKILLELEQINEAIIDFRKAIELDNSKVEYHTALGDAYFMNGDVGNSYSCLQKALKIAPDNLEALLKMGEISFYSKDYDRALETLSKVTKIEKDNRTAHFMKGFIYKEKGDTAAAVQLFRRVIELYPDYEPAYEELGLIYAQEKNILAEEYLTTAIQLEPKNINALYALAMLYQEIEQPDKATELYVRILEVDPQNKYAWHNRGYMEMLLYEDYDNAIDFFTKAIDADNQYIEAHTNRGYAYELKGDRNNARICYKTALQIDPNYEPALEGIRRVGEK